MGAAVLGTGGRLPERVVDNAELAERLGVTPDWILKRTGIERRHLASPGEPTSLLAADAARAALADAGLEPEAVDLLVVATVTPEQPLPAAASLTAARLGLRCAAVDLGAACAGFIYALAFAHGQIAAGTARTVLVVGAEVLSPFIPPTDRDVAVLFGDGAGAVVLGAVDGADAVRAVHLGGDPGAADILDVRPGERRLRMQGRRVYRQAVKHLPGAARAAMDGAGWTPDDVDWLVPHQANARVVRAVAARVELPMERCLLTIAEHGNTSAASIPLTLASAARDGRLRAGQRLLLLGLGAGLTWGAVALRWGPRG